MRLIGVFSMLILAVTLGYTAYMAEEPLMEILKWLKH